MINQYEDTSAIENKVFRTESESTPLCPEQLAIEANLIGGKISPSDYPSRISGKICECSSGGEFILLPISHSTLQEGGKRYMKCKKCGYSAHL